MRVMLFRVILIDICLINSNIVMRFMHVNLGAVLELGSKTGSTTKIDR
ncbi:hypothetical protein C8R21_1514 [Nitrosospira multiformis]|uniref:Uncharacterized protein n=1 Tax=Nitrosospira multiformis TaxID=1231 RepID=A0A2T5I100_9PROT|nr:hypothetical protein C8R21_1514 [Nitrosospira multiformis]